MRLCLPVKMVVGMEYRDTLYCGGATLPPYSAWLQDPSPPVACRGAHNAP